MCVGGEWWCWGCRDRFTVSFRLYSAQRRHGECWRKSVTIGFQQLTGLAFLNVYASSKAGSAMRF